VRQSNRDFFQCRVSDSVPRPAASTHHRLPITPPENLDCAHRLLTQSPQCDGALPPPSSAVSTTVRLLPSHLLPALVGLAQSVLALSPVLEGCVRFHLVLDANILQGELRWRLGRRIKPHAHTGLEGAIRAGVLVAYLPAIVEQEISGDTGAVQASPSAFDTSHSASKGITQMTSRIKPGVDGQKVNALFAKASILKTEFEQVRLGKSPFPLHFDESGNRVILAF